jgi:hypothetical protein
MAKRGIRHGDAPGGAAMTFEDIGAMEGISRAAARRTFLRAVQKLKRCRWSRHTFLVWARASMQSRRTILHAGSVECDQQFVRRYADSD